VIDEIIEEHIKLFRTCEGHEATTMGHYDGPIGTTEYCDGSCAVFSPHDVALAALDTACAQGFVDPDDDPGCDLACTQFEEKARYLMGL
jgi:hypothetical protein